MVSGATAIAIFFVLWRTSAGKGLEIDHLISAGLALALMATIYFSQRAGFHAARARDSETRLRALIECASYAMVIAEPEGRIVLVNGAAERLFGYPRAELLEKPDEILITDRDRARYRNYCREFTGNSLVPAVDAGLEMHGLRKDGTELPVEVKLSNLSTGGGMLICSSILDVTRRKRYEAALAQRAAELEGVNRELIAYSKELERSNADLQQFAYVASHDLQEPLRMVASYTELLAKRYADKLDENAREFIDFAVDGATRMQSLINDLLSYSRVQTQGHPLQRTDAEKALELSLKDLAHAVQENAANVTHDELPEVTADPTQLRQVFQNLIGNAIRFRREDLPPEIHISADRNARSWRFSVRDNGIGMEPGETSRIFTIFQRLHTRAEYPGTGIGLAICKRIVERHGGEIWVKSAPGEGSTFYFTIPDRPEIDLEESHAS